MKKNTVKFLMEKGFIQYAIVAVGFLKEPGRTETIKEMLYKCIKKGWIDGAWSMAELLERKLIPNELRVIFDKGVQEMSKLLERDLAPHEFEAILKLCLNNGLLEDARAVAKKLDYKLTRDDFEIMIARRVKDGRLSGARAVAKLLGREITSEEVETVIGKCVSDGRLDDALKAAVSIGRELTQKELEAILDKCAEKNWVDVARKVMKLIDIKLMREELKTAFAEQRMDLPLGTDWLFDLSRNLTRKDIGKIFKQEDEEGLLGDARKVVGLFSSLKSLGYF